MKDQQTLSDITANILNRIKAMQEEVTLDNVIAHDDTGTTFVTALDFCHSGEIIKCDGERE